MTEAHITAVRKLRGESVQYWKGGEIKQGILEDISYISNSDDLHAHIKRLLPSSGRELVPVADVIISGVEETPDQMDTITAIDIAQKKSDDPNTFRYGNEIYSKIQTDECVFFVDDEVVWNVSRRDPSNESPFIGTIKFVGKNKKNNVIAAVVHFDQPTGHLPQYIRELPNNRNLVNILELMFLPEWIEKQQQQNFYDSHETSQYSLPDSTTLHIPDETRLLSIDPVSMEKQPANEIIQGHQVDSSTTPVISMPPPVVVNEHIQTPLIFKNGGKEYVEFTGSHFKIGDQVVWLLVHEKYNCNEPFSGCIEFIGRIRETDDDDNVVYAVVKFEKPTWELPGYVKNPPKNRNVVDTNDLLITSQWKAILQRGLIASPTNKNANKDSNNEKAEQVVKKEAAKKVVKLIGNCLAVEYGIDRKSVKEVIEGDFIILKVKTAECSKTILGEVKICCKIKRDDDAVKNEIFVGVEFQKTLNTCSPTIDIVHKVAKDLECKKCQHGKLVMISMNTLKKCNPENSNCTFYIVSHKKPSL